MTNRYKIFALLTLNGKVCCNKDFRVIIIIGKNILTNDFKVISCDVEVRRDINNCYLSI